MGSEPSKPKEPLLKPDQNKIDTTTLPKLDTSKFNLPKAPVIKTKSMLKREKEDEELKSLQKFKLAE